VYCRRDESEADGGRTGMEAGGLNRGRSRGSSRGRGGAEAAVGQEASKGGDRPGCSAGAPTGGHPA
jgi:hypothetical protein